MALRNSGDYLAAGSTRVTDRALGGRVRRRLDPPIRTHVLGYPAGNGAADSEQGYLYVDPLIRLKPGQGRSRA